MNLFITIRLPDASETKASISIDNIREIIEATPASQGYTEIIFVGGDRTYAIEPRADLVAEITEIQDSAARRLALAQRLTK